MSTRERRSERGSAMLVAVLMMVLMALIGISALETVSRDRQVAGYQFRKKAAFYAAEAGVATALESLLTGGAPAVPSTELGDDTIHPHGQPRFSFDGPVYVSFDLDVLDPAFAPGVSHHEPGGFSTRQVVDMIGALKGEVVGADIVELNPRRDPVGITEMAAAKILKELAAKMLAI